MHNEESCGMGIFIDIYPYDGFGNDKDVALEYGRKGDLLSSFCYQATRKSFAVETTVSPIRKLLKLPIFIIAKIIGKDFFQKRLQSLVGIYDYDDSKYVGCIVWLSGGEKDIFLKEWFEESILVQFENYQFRISMVNNHY